MSYNKRISIKIIFLSLMIFFLIGLKDAVSGVPPIKQWDFKWGGNEYDEGYGVAIDSLGNIYVVGYTDNYGAGNEDICLLKFNSNGIKLWNKTWGGSGIDKGNAITLDSNDNIYIAGTTMSFGASSEDFCLVKFNSTGHEQWYSIWGEIDWEKGYDIVLDSANNAYIVGTCTDYADNDKDVCLVKFNSTGGVNWSITWGGPDDDEGAGLDIDSLGNIYVTGRTLNNFGAIDSDLCLLKFNSSGDREWNYTWGGSGTDFGKDLVLDSSGNIYVTGITNNLGENVWDVCLIKFNSDGGLIWNENWGGSGFDQGNAVTLDSSGNIYVAGETMSFDAVGTDLCSMKFNSTGSVQWYEMWDAGNIDIGQAIALDSLGNIYIAGWTQNSVPSNTDICLLKYYCINDNGNGNGNIPGYDLFLLIGIFSLISIFYIRKRYIVDILN